MQSIFIYLEDIISTYWENSKYQLLLYIAILSILLLEKESSKKITFGWYGIVCFAGLLNPITVKITSKVWGESVAYYCRQISIIPIFLVIAYGTVLMIDKLKDNQKAFITCFVILFFVVNGYQIYNEEWYTKAINIEKIPCEVIDIAQFFEEQNGKIKVAVSTDVGTYMRQYTNVIQSQGRVEWDSVFERELKSDNPEVVTLMEYAGEQGCDFLVAKKNVNSVKCYKKNGYEPDFETENLAVYRVEGIRRWKCTYNGLNQLEKITFVDENGKAICSPKGYAQKKYTYNKQGDVLSECYYDEQGNPIAAELGQFVTFYEYDCKDKTKRIVYCDQYEQPMQVKTGYAMIEYMYDTAGNVICEKYYNEKGASEKLQMGQAGETREYDVKGNMISRRYINEKEQEIELTTGYSRVEYIYDIYGNVEYEKYYNIEGDEVEIK